MKRIYLIRHCEAEGQPFEAQLSERGFRQAVELTEFFSTFKIDRIISSPFMRAIQSIQPLAMLLQVPIEEEPRLTERVLSNNNLPDWLEKLSATLDDLDLKFEGGESSREAMQRIVGVVEEVFVGETENTIIVSHGNLLSLLLKYFNKDFGFDEWRNLSNPDVFILKSENKTVSIERVWK
ncbi:histidine phosphatase family protein [Neobacillus sp. NPDC058068]|uniref:histidine phosphatase family protein n=1 Tax=Neobacillus sp. NPDC058068 TaxID=3346325 RepID=UPI0036D80D53